MLIEGMLDGPKARPGNVCCEFTPMLEDENPRERPAFPRPAAIV